MKVLAFPLLRPDGFGIANAKTSITVRRILPSFTASLLLLGAMLGCSRYNVAPPKFLLDDGVINQNTNVAGLRRIYGDANVRDERIELGEGETVPGTVLFPDDSTRRLMIVWTDTIAHSKPLRLILRASRSRWSLSSGVFPGVPLGQLESLNGRPFSLAGFGWDYAGVVIDWHGGALEKPMRNVKVYLAPDFEKQSNAEYSRVLGDRDYSSASPAMRALQPTVYQIFYDFERSDTDARAEVGEGRILQTVMAVLALASKSLSGVGSANAKTVI